MSGDVWEGVAETFRRTGASRAAPLALGRCGGDGARGNGLRLARDQRLRGAGHAGAVSGIGDAAFISCVLPAPSTPGAGAVRHRLPEPR